MCIRSIVVALDKMLLLRISLGCATQESTAPMLTKLQLIGTPFVFSFKERGILEFEHNQYETDYVKMQPERFAVAEGKAEEPAVPRRHRSR